MNTSKYISIGLLCVLSLTAEAKEILLTRDECRSLALRHSEELKKADNASAQAALDLKIATTAYLPKIDGSATALYMAPDIDMMGSKMQNKGTYLAGLQLVQPIYAGGRITAGRKLARIGKEVSEQQRELCRMDIIADADNAYWTYIAVRDKVQLMQAYRNMVDTLYEQTRTAVENGMAVENDLLRISAKRSEIIYQTQKAANGAELCRMSLCNIIGEDFDTDITPLDTVPECRAPGVLDADVASRPEYRLLEKQIEAARQQVNLTRGEFLPTIGLSVGYNYYGNIRLKGMADAGGGNYVPYTQKFSDGIFMGAVSVSIPLFHWGEGYKKVKKAKIAVENSKLDLQHSTRLLDLQMRQAAANLNDGWNMIQSSHLSLEQATENLRVMQNRYEEAMVSLTDMLDAQTQWQQAKSDAIEAATQYQIYLTAWLRASGRL